MTIAAKQQRVSQGRTFHDLAQPLLASGKVHAKGWDLHRDDFLCVDQGATATLKQNIQALRGQVIDVARFEELTGVSRKYAIPLPEDLDRGKVTRKQGSCRFVL